MVQFVLFLVVVEHEVLLPDTMAFSALTIMTLSSLSSLAAFNRRSAVADASLPRIMPSASNTNVFSAKDNNLFPWVFVH